MTRRSARVQGRTATLVGGQKLRNVHERDRCVGLYCCIHRFSKHPMRDFRQNWRSDRRMMERICPCGIGHPDPDHLTWVELTKGLDAAKVESVHGCCGIHCGTVWTKES